MKYFAPVLVILLVLKTVYLLRLFNPLLGCLLAT